MKVLEMDNGLYECNYYPIKTGKYIISITWGGHSIPRRLGSLHRSLWDLMSVLK